MLYNFSLCRVPAFQILSSTVHEVLIQSVRFRTCPGGPYRIGQCARIFSDGSRLASGSQDGSLVIWEPSTGVTKYHIVCPSVVLSLVWDPRYLNRLFVGCENGVLAVLNNFEAWCYLHCHPLQCD